MHALVLRGVDCEQFMSHLLKHALLHVGCHDGVDGDYGSSHTTATPQKVLEVLLCL